MTTEEMELSYALAKIIARLEEIRDTPARLDARSERANELLASISKSV